MSTSVSITNSGIIEELPLPDGFNPPEGFSQQPNNYLEYHGNGSFALICYEQTNQPFIKEDIAKVEQLLQEDLVDKDGRTLNISGAPDQEKNDSDIFEVLCFCFVFGGYLTRDNLVMDMDKCTWRLQKLGEGDSSKTIIVGHLRFVEPGGKRSKREVVLALPQAPSESGCGYLWLEGNGSEIRRFERKFLASVASGKFRALT